MLIYLQLVPHNLQSKVQETFFKVLKARLNMPEFLWKVPVVLNLKLLDIIKQNLLQILINNEECRFNFIKNFNEHSPSLMKTKIIMKQFYEITKCSC